MCVNVSILFKLIGIFKAMSDILSPVANLKYQDCINLSTNHSPCYVNKMRVNKSEVVLTLHISSKGIQYRDV